MVIPLSLLIGCEQYNFLCKKEAEKDAAPVKKMAVGSQPAGNKEAVLMKQLEQVTQDLVEVKIQRDLLKQELAAYRKRYPEK